MFHRHRTLDSAWFNAPAKLKKDFSNVETRTVMRVLVHTRENVGIACTREPETNSSVNKLDACIAVWKTPKTRRAFIVLAFTASILPCTSVYSNLFRLFFHALVRTTEVLYSRDTTYWLSSFCNARCECQRQIISTWICHSIRESLK